MKSHTEENRIRPDILTSAVYLSVVFMMVFCILCQRIFGDKGAYFAAAPCFIYAFWYMGIVLAAQKAVYVMVRLRARRSQYLNAEVNMHKSIRLFAALSLLFGVLLMAVSYQFAGKLLGTPRGFFQLVIIGASIIFLGGQGTIRGYLQGIGYTKPIFISDILISSVSLVVGTTAVALLYRYGLKVNDLFHVDEFSAIYGSCGMMIGFFAGSLAGFIQTFVSFQIRKAEIAEFVKAGAPRYLDNKNDVFAGIRPHLLLYISLPLMALVDQIFYSIYSGKVSETSDFMTEFGVYAGRIMTVIILISVMCSMLYVRKWNRIMARFERDELEGARERYKNTMRHFNLFLLPVTAFIFSLPETVQTVFIGKSLMLAEKLMMPSAVCVFFLSSAIMNSWLISHMGKSVVTIVNCAIAWGVHIVGAIVFVVLLKLGVMGLLISTTLALVVYDLVSYYMISKILYFRIDFRTSFLIPFVGSVLTGLLVFLVNKLLVNVIGEILTCIICIIIYWFVFMLMMIATKTIRYHELSRIPLGSLLKSVAVMLGNGKH